MLDNISAVETVKKLFNIQYSAAQQRHNKHLWDMATESSFRI